MNLAYAAYAALSTGAYLSVCPFYWLKTRSKRDSRRIFSQRMGCYDVAHVAAAHLIDKNEQGDPDHSDGDPFVVSMRVGRAPMHRRRLDY